MNSRASLLLATALLAAGCTFYTQDAEKSETRNWPAAQAGAIAASIDYGAIAVTGQAGSEVTAVITRRCRGTVPQDAALHLKEVAVTDSLSGGTLYLSEESPRPNYRNWAADIALSVPAATALDINASNGAVTLTNTKGTVNINAANGAVLTTAHQGNLVAYATNGAINADISRVDASGSISLHSVDGAVTLSLPANASVEFNARSGNGAVNVEGLSGVRYTLDDSSSKSGTLGTGLAKVEVSSDNGSVTIRAR